MKKEAWRETGEIIRERWRTCLSEYASLRIADGYRYENFDPENLLIELPVHWFADGFAIGTADKCQVKEDHFKKE